MHPSIHPRRGLRLAPFACLLPLAGCGGGSGDATQAAAPAPTVSLVASPANIGSGETGTLTWSSTHADTCTASGDWSGSKAVSGSEPVTPSESATYTLSCAGAGGTGQASATIAVSAAAPTAASASTLGPLAVQSYANGIVIPAGARFQQPKIWYPSGGAGPYPGVVIVPGYNGDYLNPPTPVDENQMTQWAQFLGSHGFVVMFVNSATIATDGAAQKTDALLDAVDALAAEAARVGSPIAGLLQPQNIAVMGHSLGGSAALYAANAGVNARIKGVVALSPVPGNANAGPYPNDTVPSLLMGGQGDSIYTNFQGEYDTIPGTTSKMLAVFNKANTGYFSMHSIALNPLGAHVSDPLVARYGLSFLEVYLVGDARYQQFLVNDPLLQAFAYNP
jgi:dienelactone hydrolase